MGSGGSGKRYGGKYLSGLPAAANWQRKIAEHVGDYSAYGGDARAFPQTCSVSIFGRAGRYRGLVSQDFDCLHAFALTNKDLRVRHAWRGT
jgi:hypothetical protein